MAGTYNSVTQGAFDITIDGVYYDVGDGKVSTDFAPYTVEPAGGSNHATKKKKQQTMDCTLYKGTGFDLAKLLTAENVTVRCRGLDGHTYELRHARRTGDAKSELANVEFATTFSAGTGNAFIDGKAVK